jgi:processive 1,2-diacylglycerol beta-glucosyltransferase
VQEALQSEGLEAQIVDYVDWLHPAIRSFAKFSLLQGVKKAPGLYGWFYRSTSRLEPPASLQRRLNRLGIAHMKRWLRTYQPHVVASTFPIPSGVMSELRSTGETDVPSTAIVTDYTAHRQWFQSLTDVYFVATEAVKEELIRFGVQPERVEVTGIPIRRRFRAGVPEDARHRAALRQAHGLSPDLPLVLMMGGGAGVFADVAAWETVMQDVPAQFVVICGKNERLFRRLRPLASQRVRILGYVAEIEEWMAMADLIISKAGAITVTEALAMELPMLLFRPIPGQEEKNAQFAVEVGAAIVRQDVRSARQFLVDALTRPGILQAMRAAAGRVRVDDGAVRIARRLRELALGYARQGQGVRPAVGRTANLDTPVPKFSS